MWYDCSPTILIISHMCACRDKPNFYPIIQLHHSSCIHQLPAVVQHLCNSFKNIWITNKPHCWEFRGDVTFDKMICKVLTVCSRSPRVRNSINHFFVSHISSEHGRDDVWNGKRPTRFSNFTWPHSDFCLQIGRIENESKNPVWKEVSDEVQHDYVHMFKIVIKCFFMLIFAWFLRTHNIPSIWH